MPFLSNRVIYTASKDNYLARSLIYLLVVNCHECKDLLSPFIDGDLAEENAASVRAHLCDCGDCATVLEELTAMLGVCAESNADELVPPNSNALWCRINNIIESEIETAKAVAPEPPKRRFWHLSLPQLGFAVLAIALVSSVLTLAGLRYYSSQHSQDFTLRSSDSQTMVEKLMARVGLIDTPQQARDRRVKEQQAAIAYWDARIQARRAQWDKRTREVFDRNLQVIDQSLNNYMVILAEDPDDDLSGEMLDSVLNDKMDLLRDFSDL